MKKRVIFLCLGVLLFTCTFAFAAETKQQSGESENSPSDEERVIGEVKKEELRVEVVEGKRIYVRNDKKINIEKIVIPKSEIREVESIVVRGKEVFLHEYEKKEEGIEKGFLIHKIIL
ncbi:MAG: hypothetical protein LBB44_01115 [Endomicrobium sp.]|jgi:hypothetical protein|nr:hypothetical protein [Endomicrobium sp.]